MIKAKMVRGRDGNYYMVSAERSKCNFCEKWFDTADGAKSPFVCEACRRSQLPKTKRILLEHWKRRRLIE